MEAPERLDTRRLVLRRPHAADADAIFNRYAGDREVTRLMGWPVHRSVTETRAFIAQSDAEWDRWPAGPYLICEREGGAVLGSTGFSFETPIRAATGYILTKDAWGQGYAAEALEAIVEVAPLIGVRRLYAVCHTAHRASARVLEKCGFEPEATLRHYMTFPNLGAPEPADVLCYARIW